MVDLVGYRLQLLRRYSTNGLNDKCHLLSKFTTTKFKPESEPTKVMRRGDEVAKELRYHELVGLSTTTRKMLSPQGVSGNI